MKLIILADDANWVYAIRAAKSLIKCGTKNMISVFGESGNLEFYAKRNVSGSITVTHISNACHD